MVVSFLCCCFLIFCIIIIIYGGGVYVRVMQFVCSVMCFYSTTHSTHFIYGYMAKDHSDSERGKPLPPHGLLFPNRSKGSFICTISQT